MTMNIVVLMMMLGCCSFTSATGNGTGATGNGTAPCRNNLAISFCLDSSGSMTKPNFDQQKDAVTYLIDRLNMSSGNVQLTVASYGSNCYPPVNNYTRNSTLAKEMVKNTTYRGSTTETGLCLKWANGLHDTYGDPKAVCAHVVITDGGSTNQTQTLETSQQARDKGCIVITIGIGDKINLAELKAMSTNNSVILIESFNDLPKILDQLTEKVCNGKPAPPCPSNISFNLIACVDSSGSINKTEFPNNGYTLSHTIQYFEIGVGKVQVAISIFGSHNLNQTDGLRANRTEVQQGIDKMPYRGSETRIDLCIDWAVKVFKADGRKVPSVLVSLTDGVPTDGAAANKSVAAAKAEGIFVEFVGIGPEPNLKLLANLSSSGEVIRIGSYVDLPKLAYIIAKKVCDAALPPKA